MTKCIVAKFYGYWLILPLQFRSYVNKLRSKSTIYKKKRQVLQDLKAESGVVSRTVEILKARDSNINQQLEALESKKGVAGYRDTQDELEKVRSFLILKDFCIQLLFSLSRTVT